MFLLIFASTAEYSAAAVLLFGSIVLLVGLLMLLPRRFHWAIFCFSTLLLQLSQLPFTQALNISLFNNNFASVWWIFDFLVYKFWCFSFCVPRIFLFCKCVVVICPLILQFKNAKSIFIYNFYPLRVCCHLGVLGERMWIGEAKTQSGGFFDSFNRWWLSPKNVPVLKSLWKVIVEFGAKTIQLMTCAVRSIHSCRWGVNLKVLKVYHSFQLLIC